MCFATGFIRLYQETWNGAADSIAISTLLKELIVGTRAKLINAPVNPSYTILSCGVSGSRLYLYGHVRIMMRQFERVPIIYVYIDQHSEYV